jgi:hypothetical protein
VGGVNALSQPTQKKLESLMAITEAQVNAALRHVASYGSGAATVALFLGILSPESSKEAISYIKQIVDGLTQATGGLFGLSVIVFPVLSGFAAKYAAASASPRAQIMAVASNPSVQKIIMAPATPSPPPAPTHDKIVPYLPENQL